MDRNCNTTRGGLQVMYRPATGVLGSLIPASGDTFASIMYPQLVLPADANDEFSYWVEDFSTIPAGFFPLADDGSGTRGPYPDGVYGPASVALYRWDVRQYAFSFTLTVGATVPVLSAPVVSAFGATTATVGCTTDTAPTVTALAVQVLPAATAAPAAADIVASPTQTMSTGAAGARTFNLTGLATGDSYRAHFAQGASSNVVSTAAFVAGVAPSFSAHPASGSYEDGDAVTLTATSAGAPTPTYQWQRNTGSGWANISGATSASFSFTFAAVDSGHQYRRLDSNAVQSNVASNAATITLALQPGDYLPQPTTAASWNYRQTATLWRLIGRDAWGGQVTHGAPGLFLCDYAEDERRLRMASGEEFVSQLLIYTSLPGVQQGDMVLIGESSNPDPYAAGASEVRAVRTWADTFTAEGPPDFRIAT